MMNSEPNAIQKVFQEGALIDEAMNAAVRDAVQVHKEKNLPMVVWRNGEIVWISPEEAEQSLASATPQPPAE